jgi:hypothetical protein
MRIAPVSVLTAALAVIGLTAAAAEPSTATRADKIKAAFVLDFARHVLWPQEIGSTVRLCTIGADPLADAWDSIAERQVHGRPLEVERDVALDRIDECLILAIGALTAETAVAVNEQASKYPVLTVADDATPAGVDAILRLKSIDNRLRFDIDLPDAEQRGLRIAPQLRDLADNIDGAPNDEAGE